MQSRMKNPALVLPDAMAALMALGKASRHALPARTLHLVLMRASQINGCAVCLDMHWRPAKKEGETDERLHALAAWRETPFFSESERAALALTEATTRIADKADAVPDDVWNAAAKHFDERQLSELLINIGMINLWNRLNAATRQVVDPNAPWRT